MQKILIVNDSATVNRILKHNLDSEGINVESVLTGREGITRAAENQYDLILLDYNLPDINGDVVCSAIKKDKNTKHIPLYFISAMDKDAMSKVIARTGAEGWFDITIEVEEVIRKIKALMDSV